MHQEAFLLEQLAQPGANSKTAGELNKKIGRVAQRVLQLEPKNAKKIRSELADRGYLAATKKGQSVFYALTEAGRSYLATLERPTIPTSNARKASIDESRISDELREAQKAYILLQLLDADERTLSRSRANKGPRDLLSRLGLKADVANYRRAKLADQGYIRVSRSGKAQQYTLTPDGLEYLAAGAKHLDHGEFTISGKTLNVLIAAARESSFQTERPSAQPLAIPSTQQLAEAVLEEVQELRRERYSHSGLVPIHEIRQRMATRFGTAAGRHDILDEAILELWRQRRVGLEAISDLSVASQEQLDASIQGSTGVLFYLEVPREQLVAP
jgi:predicted transcriptional regulator